MKLIIIGEATENERPSPVGYNTPGVIEPIPFAEDVLPITEMHLEYAFSIGMISWHMPASFNVNV